MRLQLESFGFGLAVFMSLVGVKVAETEIRHDPTTVETDAAPDTPIRLPSGPAMPPGVSGKLQAGYLYVIDCKVKCSVRAHPAGLVSVTEKKGPRDITAKFVDGNGTEEDRTYDGPFVYVIKAVGTGRVELDVIPYGFKTDAEIVSATIDVENGSGPRPPPPNPQPDPDPKPMPVPAPGAKLYCVVIMDRLSADPMQAEAVGTMNLRSYLKSNGHELDIIDISSDAGRKRREPYQPFLTASNVVPPALVLMETEGANRGKVRSVVALPKTDMGIIDTIKAVTGGK